MSITAARRPGLLAVVAALVGAAVLLPPGAAFAAPATEAADPAAVAAEDQEEPDGPELEEERRLLDLVADAQRLLQLSGYDPGPIDGRLGLRTQRAIRAYQAAARRAGTLEALKGPARDNAVPHRELVGAERSGPGLTR